mmetsp:Transcript_103426/g.163186  ORF Transcript_103426/g.163186 Transcript_103426/m.163186 type:complete len:288 (-) Transcript_103426:12-875(-)
MWFIADACGIVCFIIGYFLLSVSNYVVVKTGDFPFGPRGDAICLAIYELWFILAIWSHLTCMLSDPGSIPIDDGVELQALPDGVRQCTKCKAPKPPRAHHCSICQRCIQRMDHHCPWVNNCVGARNQKHFVLYLLYVQLQCYMAIICLGGRFLSMPEVSSHRDYRKKVFLQRLTRSPNQTQALEASRQLRLYREQVANDETNEAGQIVGCILIFFVALVFGLFTAIMMCDQVSNIISNQSGIDALKGESPQKPKSWRDSMQEVMGRGPSWRWFLPLPLRRLQEKDET